MDGIAPLREARKAGLAIKADGDKLIIRGPRRLGDLAQRVLAHKPEVMALLRSGGLADRPRQEDAPQPPTRCSSDGHPVDLPKGWSPTSWARCLRMRAEACQELVPIIARRFRDWADILDGEAGRN